MKTIINPCGQKQYLTVSEQQNPSGPAGFIASNSRWRFYIETIDLLTNL